MIFESIVHMHFWGRGQGGVQNKVIPQNRDFIQIGQGIIYVIALSEN